MSHADVLVILCLMAFVSSKGELLQRRTMEGPPCEVMGL